MQSIGSNMYGPPAGVSAVRVGNEVLISWDQGEYRRPKDDDTRLPFGAVRVPEGRLPVVDGFGNPDQYRTPPVMRSGMRRGCALRYHGKLYTVEKARVFPARHHPLACAIASTWLTAELNLPGF
ncbi:MAG: hypothetical protein MZV64_23185 [Ignavibacteriales bacterium]|nr:hypothetical protein [Ignavibacteriales bacterium]